MPIKLGMRALYVYVLFLSLSLWVNSSYAEPYGMGMSEGAAKENREGERERACMAQRTEIAKAHGEFQTACSQIPGFSGPSLCRQNVDSCFSGKRSGEACEQIRLAQNYQTILSRKKDAESEMEKLRDDLWKVEDDMVDLQSDRTKEIFKIQKEMDELDKDLMKNINDLEEQSISARREGTEQKAQKQKMLQSLENKLKANRLAPLNLQRQYQAKYNELVLQTDINCKRYALERLSEFRNKKNALKAQGKYTISSRDALAAAMRGRKGVDQDVANQAYLYCKRDNQQLLSSKLEAMKAELDMKMQEVNLQYEDLKNEIESLKQSFIRDAQNESEDAQLRHSRLIQKVNEIQKEKGNKNKELQSTLSNLNTKEKTLWGRQKTYADLINGKTEEYKAAKTDYEKVANTGEESYKKYETMVSKREQACALIDSYRSNCGEDVRRDYCTGVPVAETIRSTTLAPLPVVTPTPIPSRSPINSAPLPSATRPNRPGTSR